MEVPVSTSTSGRRLSSRLSAKMKRQEKKDDEREKRSQGDQDEGDHDEDEDEAEEDIDYESPGSDYESTLRKAIKAKAKQKDTRRMSNGRKAMTTVESSSDDDEEEEEAVKEELLDLKDGLDKENNKMSKRASLENRKKRECLLKPKATAVNNGKATFSKMPMKPAPLPVTKSLSLSESSDDDGDDGATAKTVLAASTPPRSVSAPAVKVVTASPAKSSGPDCQLIASQLAALASSRTEASQAWERKSPQASGDSEEEQGRKRNEDKKLKESSFAAEVAEALAMGEEEGGGGLSESEGEDEAEGEKEEEAGPGKPLETVEVTVALPDKHKKKRSFDVEAYVRREINRAKRESQLAAHQAHFLCLLAHLRHLNQTARMPVLKAVALSIVPTAHAVSGSALTPVRLTQTLSWFRSAVCLTEDARPDQFPRPLVAHLTRRFEKLVTGSESDLVLMFLLVVRSLGWKARLVLNFATLPLKPDSKDLKTAKKKEEPKEEEIDEKEEEPAEKTSSSISKKSKPSEASKGKKRKEEEPKSSKWRVSTAGSRRGEGRAQDASDDDEDYTPKSKRKNGGRNSKSSKSRTREEIKEETPTSSRKRRSEGNRAPVSPSPKKMSRKEASKAMPRFSSQHVKKQSQPPLSPLKRKSSRLRDRKEEKEVRLTETALEEAKARSSARGSRARPTIKKGSPKRDEDEEFEPERPRATSTRRSGVAASKNKVEVTTARRDLWIEILVKGEWSCVDVSKGKSNCASEMEASATSPILYVVACNEDGTVKDVTRRYTGSKFMTTTRKKRVSEEWVVETMAPFRPRDLRSEAAEDRKLDKEMESAPMPTTVSAFKDHPLYALRRHLLKFESIYPPDAPTLGFIRGEAVYPRECVHTLHSRQVWVSKEGRIVKVGQEPYKVVTALPKWDRMEGKIIKGQPLDVFGRWQTEKYIPPPAEGGKVPRNEYGNVELFKPWMLPKGCTHLDVPGLARVAKKLGVDCAPAMTGWEFKNGFNRPLFEGYVVCEEFSETLMDAWSADAAEKERRAEEKREKRVLDNWKRLIKGLLIARKLKAKYSTKK